MIWDETGDVGVIVMLTQTHDAGREKCSSYYPQGEPGTVLEIGEIVGSDPISDSEDDVEKDEPDKPSFQATVELQSSAYREELRSTESELLLRVGEKSKLVHHFLFTGFPDFGIPEDKDCEALLELVKESATKAASLSNPRVIHCSAGVGRSGTFIALDYLLNELSEGSMDVDDGKDHIVECVSELRKQRMMMVQSDTQFALLYALLKEQWLQRNEKGVDESKQKARSSRT